MLSYRKINNKTEIEYAKRIWEIERTFPKWFQDSSKVWVKDFESFLENYKNFDEIYGLFDDEKLIACIFLQNLTKDFVEIHISVIERIDKRHIVRFFQSVKRLKHSEGINEFRAWILEKNKPMLNIAEEVNLKPTGLRMDYGESNNRLLGWVEIGSIN